MPIKSKVRVKRVKAYAVIRNEGIASITASVFNDAPETLGIYSEDTFRNYNPNAEILKMYNAKIVPCTITYHLPSKKR